MTSDNLHAELPEWADTTCDCCGQPCDRETGVRPTVDDAILCVSCDAEFRPVANLILSDMAAE